MNKRSTRSSKGRQSQSAEAKEQDPKKCKRTECKLAGRYQGFCSQHRKEYVACSMEGCYKAGVLNGRCFAHIYLCTIEGCENPRYYYGYCYEHARDDGPAPRCSVDGCDYAAFRRQLCSGHYYECKHEGCESRGNYKGYCYAHVEDAGDAVKVCERPNCSNPVLSRKLCRTHYAQCRISTCSRRGHYGGYCNLHSPHLECKLEGCFNRSTGRDYCQKHALLGSRQRPRRPTPQAKKRKKAIDAEQPKESNDGN